MRRFAKVLDVSEGDREVLQSRVRAKSSQARQVERARIVLLAAEGVPAQEIAARIGCSRPTVSTWRRRFEEGGIDALDDAPRSGAPPTIDRGKREQIHNVNLTVEDTLRL